MCWPRSVSTTGGSNPRSENEARISKYLHTTVHSQEAAATFVPREQETYSNIMYTGRGFIPDHFIAFHTQWHARMAEEE